MSDGSAISRAGFVAYNTEYVSSHVEAEMRGPKHLTVFANFGLVGWQKLVKSRSGGICSGLETVSIR